MICDVFMNVHLLTSFCSCDCLLLLLLFFRHFPQTGSCLDILCVSCWSARQWESESFGLSSFNNNDGQSIRCDGCVKLSAGRRYEKDDLAWSRMPGVKCGFSWKGGELTGLQPACNWSGQHLHLTIFPEANRAAMGLPRVP